MNKKQVVTKLAGIFLLLILHLSFVRSQDTLLTISGAVNYSFDHNSDLKQMEMILKQEREKWKTRTGISQPEVSYFREGMAKVPENFFDEQRISVSQEIDFPLSTYYRLKGTSQEVSAMELMVEARRRELRSEVKRNYIEVLYSFYLRDSRMEQLRIAEELYNAVYTKMQTGMANGVDLANAELQKEQAQNDLDETEWILHRSRYGLFYAMGLAPEEQKYSIQFSDTLRAYEVEISQIQSLSLQDSQPEYLAVGHELKAADYFLREARSDMLPDINLSMYKQDYGDGFNFSGFEIGLTIPLWYPLNNKGRINLAMAEREKLAWKREEVKLETKRGLEYAWHNYSVSLRIMQRYNDTMKEKAEKLRLMALKSYQIGEIGLLELLNAQKTYFESEQNYLSALRNYFLQLATMEKYFDMELVY